MLELVVKTRGIVLAFWVFLGACGCVGDAPFAGAYSAAVGSFRGIWVRCCLWLVLRCGAEIR